MDAMITLTDLCTAEGRYDEALALAEPLLALYENDVGFDRLLLARTLTRVADLHNFAKRPEAALPVLERAVKVAESVMQELGLDGTEIEKRLSEAGPEAFLRLSEARKRLWRNSPRPFRDLQELPLRHDLALGAVEVAETAAEALKALGEHYWKIRRRKPSALSTFLRLMPLLDSPLQFEVSTIIRYIFKFADKAKTPRSRAAALPLARFGLQLADREWGCTSDRVLSVLARVLELEHRPQAAQRLIERCREIVGGAWTNAEDLGVRERLFGISSFLLDHGDLALAAELAQSGLLTALEESWSDELGIMDWLRLTADVLVRAEQPAQLETLAGDVLAQCEELWGRDDPRLLPGLSALACARKEQGNLRAALESYERAVDLATRIWGADDSRIAPWVRRLASLQYDLGEFAAAAPLAERVLSLIQGESNEGAMESALAFRGAVRFKLGCSREAGIDWEQSMELKERLQGAGSARSATTMFNLAAVYRINGDYGRADSLLQSALEIESATNGQDSPEVGTTLRGFGELRVAENRLEEAESFYSRSLALWKEKLEAGHEEVACVLCRQGELFSLQGRHVDAQEAFGRAVAMSEAILGKDHPQVAGCLIAAAEAQRRNQRPTVAEPQLSRALAIYEKKLGTDAPRSVACRSLLTEIRGEGAR